MNDAIPTLSRVGVLGDKASEASRRQFADVEKVAGKFGLSIEQIALSSSAEIPAAFDQFAAQQVQAVVLLGSTLLFGNRDQICSLALKHGLPTTASQPELVEAGCLMSYGSNLMEHFRRAADYVDKILKGARPQHLPIEEPTTLRLVVNRQTADTLRFTFPVGLSERIDEVVGK